MNGLQGAYGVVYRGKWLQTRVAIKQSNMMAADEEALEEFKKEAILILSVLHSKLLFN